MSEVLFIKKSETSTKSTDDVIKLFETTDNIESIRKNVENAEERLFVSWASVDAKDKAKERIPIQDLIKLQSTYMSRGGPIMDNHTNKQIGKTLAWKVLEHPKTKTLGILHLNKIYNDYVSDDSAWQEIVQGKRVGSSVGGVAEGSIKARTKDGEPVDNITGFSHIETSSVFEPCNQYALNEAFSVVAKSESAEKVGDKDIHSDKWKRCVKQVQTNNPEVDAYAICTAQLGAESFKSNTYIKMVEEKKKEEVKTDDTIKQDGEDMTPETSEVSQEDMMKLIQTLMDRLDEVEATIAGKTEEDKAEDEEEPMTEDEEEKKKSEEEESKEEEQKEKPKETEKSDELEKVKSELLELKKKFKATKVIKSERPATEPIKKLSALDVARGKASSYEVLAQRRGN